MKIKMNIPKFLFYFVLTFPFFQLQSQNSSEDCRENLSIFAESAKIKNYKAAYEPWMSVRTNCPKYSLATFQYGELILKDFIKNFFNNPFFLLENLIHSLIFYLKL